MTDRISKPLAPMQEYGRKPYLVTKNTVPLGEEADYRYMMDKTWAKAQDDKYIVVQSVKKKPYNEQDYQMMENGGDLPVGVKWTFPKFTNVIPSPTQYDEPVISKNLSWVSYPRFISKSKFYTIIVANSYRSTNGNKVYHPTKFTIEPKTFGAKGISIVSLEDKEASTWITLQTTDYLEGEFYITATDGANTIDASIVAETKATKYFVIGYFPFPPPFTYYKLEDLADGMSVSYAAYTQQSGLREAQDLSYAGSYVSIAVDSFHTQLIYTYSIFVEGTGSTIALTSKIQDIYYDTSGSTSFGTTIGTDRFADGIYSINNSYGTNTYTVQNGYQKYYQYSPYSLVTISYTYSLIASNGDIDITGVELLDRKESDDASYLNVWEYFSGGDVATGYLLSGSFMGSNISLALTWSPNILFGTV